MYQPVPGQIWWAYVPFEDCNDGKYRPCLVLHRNGYTVRVLKITSKDKRGRSGYVRMPTSAWNASSGKSSWLQLRPVFALDYSAGSFTRFLGPCDRRTWAWAQLHHPLLAAPAGHNRAATPPGTVPALAVGALAATVLCCPVAAAGLGVASLVVNRRHPSTAVRVMGVGAVAVNGLILLLLAIVLVAGRHQATLPY
ncbi:hypothetical protein AMES_8044 [Amycolatopsis mediterranei S699]|uniref:Uncharacterized protein n=2 Tax=Amycolatopsis mediterranei TaxID=33910 RepID=A0A0H3DJL5_AMYMU|nr:type II toxin-antitoxin system PemK/MazF family toxin [Amycolatopsis mediterranei]ADJ49869.1 conserved hypothetical protein [Amycolatopsis mediterranei U32]AEK46859.1 hypothetical protein RAM_41960 [Amycolatopsis mediterranei S699]AFO81577.1 hypothetical protein AMES_8044 [Amycolatopsis mediterranei S699]AGT88706.1 hypothetical protein B737_8045 [Amycolatopsis mediterranei RB]UZF74874.1 type II toxin-antitoxin system PemK/MazF family toxin [Amycolatopsis mediterranei]